MTDPTYTDIHTTYEYKDRFRSLNSLLVLHLFPFVPTQSHRSSKRRMQNRSVTERLIVIITFKQCTKQNRPQTIDWEKEAHTDVKCRLTGKAMRDPASKGSRRQENGESSSEKSDRAQYATGSDHQFLSISRQKNKSTKTPQKTLLFSASLPPQHT